MQIINSLKSVANSFKLSNIANPFKSFSNVESSLLAIFILYLVLPIQTPSFLVGLVNSTVSMIIIFAITVYLFLYSNPILAILYIFVAYELLRRSANVHSVKMAAYTPTQAKKDSDLIKMNPSKERTLEEEVVEQMAPVGKSDPSVYVSSSYKPVAENVQGASVF
jgi:hypothetical protein